MPQPLFAAPVPATYPIAEGISQFLLGIYLALRIILLILCMVFFVGFSKANDTTTATIDAPEVVAVKVEPIDASASKLPRRPGQKTTKLRSARAPPPLPHFLSGGVPEPPNVSHLRGGGEVDQGVLLSPQGWGRCSPSPEA